MAGYIYFVKFTAQGLSNIKDIPQRLKDGRTNCEKLGATVVGIWATFGQYDAVVVVDAPNDHVAATIALVAGSSGLWTTETSRALSEDELAQIVSGLP